jgi:putative protease
VNPADKVLPPSADQVPEILAPAGGRAQLDAAVWAGADAVYFGLDSGLNARARATSFSRSELPTIMDELHTAGVRGYLALNTLVFDEELAKAERVVAEAAEAGVDALIVQDIGLTRLARSVAPHLPLHASTQMSITDAAGAAFAQGLGCRRVVVGRELSIDDIAVIAANSPIEIEAFVHGALCVSYSGQCFSSEAWGGRSANRGRCAQACRLPYGLIVDGEPRDIAEMPYLLSPQDLMAIELLPRLVKAGVRCFKIEGRLKGPDYVATTVGAYRETLDRIMSDSAACDAEMLPLESARRRELAQVFSRGQDAAADGLTPGFLLGSRHQELVIGRNPRHRGLYLGRILDVTRQAIRVRLEGPVKRGDGLLFEANAGATVEVGARVYEVLDENGRSLEHEIDRGEVRLTFGPDFDTSTVETGTDVWRSSDATRSKPPRLDPRLANWRSSVAITVELRRDKPLHLSLDDGLGHQVSVDTEHLLEPASGQPLSDERIRKAIGTFGDAPFRLGSVRILRDATDPPLFLPVGDIKAARRTAVERMLVSRRRHRRDRDLAAQPVLTHLLPSPGRPTDKTVPRLHLLCRSRAQVDAALELPEIDEITVDFLEVHGLKQACEAIRDAGRRLVVAAPRIFKPGEQRLWRYLCRLQPDGLLIRSSGLMQELIQRGGAGTVIDDDGTVIPRLHIDFSLNAANVLSTGYLMNCGVERLTMTHDLNAAQLAHLARAMPLPQRDRLEVVAHQHLPIFHTEYCVFARYLSSGNSFRDCGRPCEHHRLHVRDPSGGDHLVQADIGCRNTVFNASAQTAAAAIDGLIDSGIRHFRIELVDEPANEVAGIVRAYRDLMSGTRDLLSVQRQLDRVQDANGRCQGSAEGSLAVRLEVPRKRMKKPTAR